MVISLVKSKDNFNNTNFFTTNLNNEKHYGENGHIEYSWINEINKINIKDIIIQFNFQCVRCDKHPHLSSQPQDDNNLKKLYNKLRDLLNFLKKWLEQCNCKESSEYYDDKKLVISYLLVLYKLIGYNRDIIAGKGEYKISYMMIFAFYEFFPELAFYSLKCFVGDDVGDGLGEHPYGSWKDIKFFCAYIKETHGINNIHHPLIIFCIKLINERLASDYNKLCDYKKASDVAFMYRVEIELKNPKLSLVAKWIPREKSSSKYSWIYNSLAIDFFSEYYNSAKTNESRVKALKLCKTKYRKICAEINQFIDTLQIKQCNGEWSKINFNKCTSMNLALQKNAFLNIKKNGNIRHKDNDDRNQCKIYFSEFIKTRVKSGNSINGKNVCLGNFTSQALQIIKMKENIKQNIKLNIICNQYEINAKNEINNNNQITNEITNQINNEITNEITNDIFSMIDLLNLQWQSKIGSINKLSNMIAMVDVSSSMYGLPLHVAVALGILIANKSILGKRCLTFSSSPSWINLDDCNDFVSCVEVIKNANWGGNTNFYKALTMILNVIIETKMPACDVNELILVIASDMQIDYACDFCISNDNNGNNNNNNFDVMMDNIRNSYANAGLRICGEPYQPPKILFWNLRYNDGFPSLTSENNVMMMSGYSPLLLNSFCENGIYGLREYNPYSLLVEQLNNKRYINLEKFLLKFIEKY